LREIQEMRERERNRRLRWRQWRWVSQPSKFALEKQLDKQARQKTNNIWAHDLGGKRSSNDIEILAQTSLPQMNVKTLSIGWQSLFPEQLNYKKVSRLKQIRQRLHRENVPAI